jgi:hypothetical protein
MSKYTTKQKVILTIYVLVSLPLLPLMAIMYPFSKWAVEGKKPTLDLVEFLSMSVAFSLFMYLIGSALYFFPH